MLLQLAASFRMLLVHLPSPAASVQQQAMHTTQQFGPISHAAFPLFEDVAAVM